MCFRDIHKPRGQLRGKGGLAKFTILKHMSYSEKASTKEGGKSKISRNLSTWFMDGPLFRNTHVKKDEKMARVFLVSFDLLFILVWSAFFVA